MRVLKLSFDKINNNKNFLRMKCEVVDKKFTWCISNGVMPICQDVDPGPIDEDAIPGPLFENWKEFGVASGKRSKMIPDQIDLNAHPDAHSDLRLFGTINLIESFNRADFQSEDTGLKAFLQMLLKTNYIRKSARFEEDLLRAARNELKVWTEDSILAFIGSVLGKRPGNISVADVAHVVGSITGNPVDIENVNFELLSIAKLLPTDSAAAHRPDEFFCAAFDGEVMEYDIVKTLIVEADDGFYFGKGAQHPKRWGVTGPGSVMWRAEISQDVRDPKKAKVEWGPMAGTTYERAIESKRKMFPTGDDSIPFVTNLKDCSVLDSGLYPVSPRDFNTGLRYMSTTQELPIYRTCIVPMDITTLETEINRFAAANLPPDPTDKDLVDQLVKIYNSEVSSIDAILDDRHFLVYTKLTELAVEKEDLADCKDRESGAERLDTFTMPGKPQNVRALIMSVWLLTHMMSDSLAYVAAQNDDFTVESAVQYCLNKALKNKKTSNKFLVSSPYSAPLGKKRKGTREVVGLDRGFSFGSF